MAALIVAAVLALLALALACSSAYNLLIRSPILQSIDAHADDVPFSCCKSMGRSTCTRLVYDMLLQLRCACMSMATVCHCVPSLRRSTNTRAPLSISERCSHTYPPPDSLQLPALMNPTRVRLAAQASRASSREVKATSLFSQLRLMTCLLVNVPALVRPTAAVSCSLNASTQRQFSLCPLMSTTSVFAMFTLETPTQRPLCICSNKGELSSFAMITHGLPPALLHFDCSRRVNF